MEAEESEVSKSFEVPDSSGDEKKNVKNIRVGLPGGTVHQFELPPDAVLRDVVAKVFEAENLPENSRVRLISAGRLYSDHSLQVSEVAGEGGFLHAAISEGVDDSERERENEEDADGEETLVLEAVDADGEVRIIIPNLSSRSFDRLEQAGFTEEEIRLIHRQFRIMRREARERESGDIEEGQAREDDDENRVRRRREPRFPLISGAEGSNADFLMGCVCGYLLNVIALVLLLDNSATKRWRVGLVAGIATNCAFGILRTILDQHGGSFAAP